MFMIRSDRGVCGVIDLNDLLDATEGRYGEGSPRARSTWSCFAYCGQWPPRTPYGPAKDSLPAPPPKGIVDGIRVAIRDAFARAIARAIARAGKHGRTRQADLQCLVDELAAELQRLDEDLELLLTAVAAGRRGATLASCSATIWRGTP